MSKFEVDPTIYNREKKPLEELKIAMDDGKSCVMVPALSFQFSSCRFMVPYYPPPQPNQDGHFVLGAKEEWINQANLCIDDFKWLLKLKHHRFWSQVIFQKSALDGLISFLQEGYTFFSLDSLPNDSQIKKLYNLTGHLAFALLLRLTTRVESEFEWIGEKKYAAIIYDNFLISLPMLLDICSLYGKSNTNAVKNVIDGIFQIQPSYIEDVKKCAEEVKRVFLTVEGRLTGGTSSGEAIKLSDLNVYKNGLTLPALEDILLYVVDVAVTLSTFIDFYPPAAEMIHKNQMETLIASLYESIMTILQNHIRRFCNEDLEVETYFRCMKRLNIARFYLIKLFRDCLSASLNNLIENRYNMKAEEVKTEADTFITILADSVTEKCFINDYSRKYSLDHDIDIILQICPDVDTVKYDYILDYISSNENQEASKQVYQGPRRNKNMSNYQENPDHIKNDLGNEIKTKITGVELDSLVTEVKDILPHLGDGFVERCLEHFNYCSSTVINAILENTLPESLLVLDPELPIIPPEPGTSSSSSSVLPERVNVFDNDEFDIMSRDYIDKSKVHKGKRKDKHKDLKDMLDDKSHVEELREMFSKLGNIECLEDGYDDEYDDTYDSVDVSVGEAEAETDRRPLTIPRVLRQERAIREEEEEEVETSEPEERSARSNNFEAFVENPEVVRQRYEERRLSKQGKGRDVVGKPKGQGQENDVTFNRFKKGVFKSSQGNHNRRRMAQHKKQQGMFPV